MLEKRKGVGKGQLMGKGCVEEKGEDGMGGGGGGTKMEGNFSKLCFKGLSTF